jgi:2Fe-2S ferredoxin
VDVARVSLFNLSAGSKVPHITFIIPGESNQTVEAPVGSTVMRVGQNMGIAIEGACEGSMACSTCHVIVEGSWFAELPPASEEEEDILNLAPGLTGRSRLGCQIVLNESLDGIVVTLPIDAPNMMGG